MDANNPYTEVEVQELCENIEMTKSSAFYKTIDKNVLENTSNALMTTPNTRLNKCPSLQKLS